MGKRSRCGFTARILFFLGGGETISETTLCTGWIPGAKSILVSTDCILSAKTVIELYSLRFKIERYFHELKQQAGCFCYHFWTKSMPWLNHFRKKRKNHPLETVTKEKQRQKILETIGAIKCHVMLSVISMGLIQMTSLTCSSQIDVEKIRYLRTPSHELVSEATVMHYLRHHIYRLMVKTPHLSITRIILEK